MQTQQLPADIPKHYIESKREDQVTTKTDRVDLRTDQQRLKAQLEALYEAWQVRNAPNMRKLFSSDGRLLLWSTDRGERIEGRAEADREFDRWIETCPPWTSFVTHREIDVREGIAWVAEEVTGLWSHETESGSTHFRITTGWEEEGGEWKIRTPTSTSP